MIIKPAGKSPLTDEELLGLLEAERSKFTRSDEALKRALVDELTARKVYPTHWPTPDPYERMQGWGARWHLYSEPHHCPHCNADLRDPTWGPPGKREIGLSDGDSVHTWRCPDCKNQWPRGEYAITRLW